jgi:hypothetical protein
MIGIRDGGGKLNELEPSDKVDMEGRAERISIPSGVRNGFAGSAEERVIDGHDERIFWGQEVENAVKDGKE